MLILFLLAGFYLVNGANERENVRENARIANKWMAGKQEQDREHHSMKLKRTHIIAGALILFLVGFYIYSIFPYILYGSLYPLYEIHNDDDVQHVVDVEVFGVYNQSIFKEKYLLDPGRMESYPKTFWFRFNRWTDYRYEVTLDDEIVRTYEGKTSNFNQVWIVLYDKDSDYYPIVVDERLFDLKKGYKWDYY